ncbi:MAG: CPBP family intramembrane metalloprotease [Alphaproteobacteria bacterium]|nr:CPBP family intramembrane metalloprotease [Alphaproteobacteria bacterium]
MKLPSRRLLITELVINFGAVPLAIALWKPHSWIYIVLWIFAALCWRILHRHGTFFRMEWNFPALTHAVIARMLLRFIPCALAMVVFTAWMIPDHLFSLPRERPRVWVMVMILYPLLSVVPQEIIFRSYFLKRFQPLFSPAVLPVASAMLFGWVHIVLLNWVAVVFSTIGGYFFADTYSKTKSLACASFEHALYGCTLFTIGLGYYFYHGQAVQ